MSKKILIFLIVFFLLIIILTMGYFFINKKIFENEENQIIILERIYKDFMSHYEEYKDIVKLDESTLKNFITKQDFKGDNVKRLKSIEGTENNSNKEVVLSSKYNPNNNVLTIELEVKIEGRLVEAVMSEYKLYIKNLKINFKYGISHIMVE